MFKLVSAILDLPFTIVGGIWKLFKMLLGPARKYLWLVVWHAVYFFLVKPKRLIYLGVLLVFALIGSVMFFAKPVDHGEAPPLPGMEGEKTAKAATNGKKDKKPLSFGSVATLPAIKGTIVNGNSAFSARLVETMDPVDVQSYSSYFYYAMKNAGANQPYRWMASTDLFGEITAEPLFTSSSGVHCRYFSELLGYHGKGERFRGAACQRDANNWCKLGPRSALTCGIEKANGWKVFFSKYF